MTPRCRALMIPALGFLVFAGAKSLKSNAGADLAPGLLAGGELGAGVDYWATRGVAKEYGAKIALGDNANAVLSLDLIADGGAGNRRDDGVTTGAVAGRGTKIALELFATGVTTTLRGAILRFEFDATLVSFVKAENSVFPLSLPEGAVGVNLAATSPVTLASSGFLARAEFTTVADVTGREFSIRLESVTLAESPTSSDVLRTSSEITFNTVSSPDFDGDGTVGFSDFLTLAGAFGSTQGDGRYNAAHDLNSDGSIDFTDFLIFAGAFGSQVPPSGGGGTPAGAAPADQIAFDRLVVGKRILGKTVLLDFVSAGQFTEGFRRHQGRYSYTNTGPNTGNLTQNYDDSELFGGRCITEMRFTTGTSGTLRYICDDGNEGDVEPWRTTDLSAPVFVRASADTLHFAILDTWHAGQTRAYDLQLRKKTPHGRWNEVCVTYSNRSDRTITTYATPWIYSPDLELNATYEFRYRYRNSSSCQTGSPGPWSSIADGATSDSGTGGGTGGPTTPATGTSKLYWTDWGTGKIQRADLNGSSVEDLVSDAGLDGPDALALDVSGGKMYWTNVGSNKIQRANLDGSNVEDLVTRGLNVPYGLALDVSGGRMYWSNRQTGKIQRAQLDGSNVEDLLTLPGLAFPGELALDVSGGRMYWTNPGMDKIQRANLDGSNVEDLVTRGLNSPTGLALDVVGGKIYWTDRGTHKIQRVNFDGSNVEDLVSSGLNTPTGLDLDVSGGKMYWTDVDGDRIQRADLDGSNVEDLLTVADGLLDPSGLAVGVIEEPLVTVTNTRCSGRRQGPDPNSVLVTMHGTITALKTVISGTITGYANEQRVGVYNLNAMSPGQSVDFTITGTITTSESTLRCRTSWHIRGRSVGLQSGSIED